MTRELSKVVVKNSDDAIVTVLKWEVSEPELRQSFGWLVGVGAVTALLAAWTIWVGEWTTTAVVLAAATMLFLAYFTKSARHQYELTDENALRVNGKEYDLREFSGIFIVRGRTARGNGTSRDELILVSAARIGIALNILLPADRKKSEKVQASIADAVQPTQEVSALPLSARISYLIGGWLRLR